MAHRKCAAAAVWPPTFRPSLDPNEVMKHISALCAHLAKLSSGFPIPQILPNESQEMVQSEKPFSSPPTQLEREEKTQGAVQKKRVTPPLKTPKATPSPAAKQARHEKSQASQPRGRKPSKKTSNKEKEKEIEEVTVPMTNPNTWREFNLQTLVRQGGGKTDVREKGQWREDLGHKVVQFAQSDYHECELFLVEWGSWDKYVCHHCEEVITRPVDATNEAKRRGIATCAKTEVWYVWCVFLYY